MPSFETISKRDALVIETGEPKEAGATDSEEQVQIETISTTLASVQDEYSATISAANTAAQSASAAVQNANALASALGAIPQQIPTEDGEGTQDNPDYIAAKAAVDAAQQQAQMLQQQAQELKDYYGIADDDTAALQSIYSQIVTNFQSTEMPELETISDDQEYIDKVNEKLAQLSWDGKIQDDYINLTDVKVLKDKKAGADATDEEVDTQGVSENNNDGDPNVHGPNTEDTQAELENNGDGDPDLKGPVKAKDATSQIPEALGQDPAEVYGVVENGEDSLSVAGVELDFSEDETKIKEAIKNNEEGDYELSDGTKVTIAGNRYTVEHTVENDDGTKQTETINYNTKIQYRWSDVQQDGNVVHSESVRYNENGDVQTYNIAQVEYSEDDSRKTTILSSDGDYIALETMDLSNNYSTVAYTDIDGKYELGSKEQAIAASKAIAAYKEAGIDELLSPSEKLLLGDVPSLEEVINDIKNGNCDVDDIIKNINSLKD